jgi:hypothetical protein
MPLSATCGQKVEYMNDLVSVMRAADAAARWTSINVAKARQKNHTAIICLRSPTWSRKRPVASDHGLQSYADECGVSV